MVEHLYCEDNGRTHSKNCQKLVQKHIWSDYIEQAEDFRHSPQGKETYTHRSQTIERVFADAKEKAWPAVYVAKGPDQSN